MKILYITLVSALLLFSCENNKNKVSQIEDGVSLELATYRKTQVSNVNYQLDFQIPKEKTEPIPSKLVLSFQISNLDAPLLLDFKEKSSNLKSILVNTKAVAIAHEHEHIKIASKHLKIGENTIEIDFIAGESSLNRNQNYLYTLLVPDRARTLFPCFDQPNIKATYSLAITAPKDWAVLCGAPEISKQDSNGFTTHHFAETDLMSTYLFSFVAGEFAVTQYNPGDFDMTMLYRETDKEKITYSTDTIFNLHQQSLSFLEEYTNQKFPFQKLDFATIPGYQYGGMEHVGAVQYKESALFLDETSTENEKLRRLKLIAHETSHMWFGDLVTMDWFNDVWMKEVFANFIADKIANPAFPDINHDLSFMTTHYPRAYSEDRTKGSNPIRQELNNLNNAGSLYGSIIYSKTPIMMRQLEIVLGKEVFQKGVQEYIKTYSNSNATWNDLIEILAENTDIDVQKWSETWVNAAGRPIFHEQIVYDDNENISSFEISQTAEDDSYHVWPQTFDLTLVYKDSLQNISVDMKSSSVNLHEAIGKPKPLSIIYNSNGMGYGIFPMYAIKDQTAPRIEDDITRGYMFINTYENSLKGVVAPTDALEFYRQNLIIEKNELLTNLLSGYITTIFWKYLSPEERTAYQPLLADILWSQLQMEIPSNVKKTLFSTFRSIAYSEKSREQLYEVWHKDITLPNLKLNTDDYTRMAKSLALFNHPEHQSIIQETQKALENPDKLAEFNFLLPSLSNDVDVRNRFFKSLTDEKNRQKESWALNALSNLNHPLREKESLKNLRVSLDLLEEVQKTGDIFFPKGWLNNTIGRHTSAEAYSILDNFLTENPNLKPTLLSKLMQASDDLYRVRLLNEKKTKQNK
ncbi:peptidase M1 [Zobellia amurskyensis]|uniref:Aminopeptidase N n=1 Tax=Zobellia amurskyensis TaxID=248905 RepID=A0A7X2ZUL1_9FLAO|nr:M1 family aminopeptidase [Zobellia amurskyensis]MUH36688.1 peptidase M1 [Zobellia amurskyensis]